MFLLDALWVNERLKDYAEGDEGDEGDHEETHDTLEEEEGEEEEDGEEEEEAEKQYTEEEENFLRPMMSREKTFIEREAPMLRREPSFVEKKELSFIDNLVLRPPLMGSKYVEQKAGK